jgi:hypothetical protein
MAATRAWLNTLTAGGKARNPLFAWLAVALLASVGLAAASGGLTDVLPALKHLHEGIANVTPVVIGAHIAFVAYKPLKKYLLATELPWKAYAEKVWQGKAYPAQTR